MPNNDNVATIWYIREAIEKLQRAATRLEVRDGWHLEHALAYIGSATEDTELVVRRLKRECAERRKAMLQRHEREAMLHSASWFAALPENEKKGTPSK